MSAQLGSYAYTMLSTPLESPASFVLHRHYHLQTATDLFLSASDTAMEYKLSFPVTILTLVFIFRVGENIKNVSIFILYKK